jgi:predicted ATPase/DNA-binding CsgD family transcriptional regulator
VPERLAVRGRRTQRRPDLPRRPAATEAALRGLPFRLTRFIGRERELAELRKLVAEHRLVTLVGPGGVGKTRLVLELASSLREVHFVDLAAVDGPDLCTRALADAVGLRQEPGRPLLETVSAHLSRRPGHVVLDNCEHVITGARELAAGLLEACPSLSLLATTRIPLDIPGELTWSVSTLTLPEAESGSVLDSDAGRLFLDRARLVSRLEVDARTERGIAAICSRLDGLPLAIELAAGQAGELSLEAIHSGLGDHLRLLGAEAPGEARHPTVRAAVEWSYDLLEPADQALFDRLALFAESFTLEAAAAVADAAEPGIRRLVKGSLLTTVPGDPVRYRLLETLRAFGRDRLESTQRLGHVRERFLAYYADLTARAEAGLPSTEQRRWLDLLEAELPNLREAIRAGCRYDPMTAERIVAATSSFWIIRGYVEEGCELVEAVLRAAGSDGAGVSALTTYAELLGEMDSDRMRVALERAVARAVSADLEAKVRHNLLRAALGHDTREAGRGREAAAGALAAAVELRRVDLEALSRSWLCKADMEEGRYADSRAEGERAVALARSLGGGYLEGFALDQLGHLALKEGDLESAIAHHRASLRSWQAVDAPHGVQHALMNLGLLELESGRGTAARKTFKQSYELAHRSGDRHLLISALQGLGQAAAMAGDAAETERRFGAALTLSHELASDYMLASSLRGLARAAFMRRRLDRGLRLTAAAAAIYAGHTGPLDRYPRQQMDPQVEAARAALGPHLAEAAWHSGSTMDAEAAVAYGLVGEPPLEGGVALSPRERQVVTLLTRGLSNRQIAGALEISERTAEGHVERLRNKLGLANRAQVAAWGVTHSQD